jgi:dihydrofolate reductase
MIISLMVAYAKNRAIGNDNKLLWHLSDDLKNFKRVTLNHTIVMGRKTYESIGRALPNRTNIIITRNFNFKAPGCVIVHSLEEAIALAKAQGETELIITGGAQIYAEAIGHIHRAYITEVDCVIDKADTFFPEVHFDAWKKIEEFSHPKDEKNEYPWTFAVFEKPEWLHCP